MDQSIRYIINQIIKDGISNKNDLTALKRQAALKFRKPMPNNIDLLSAYREIVQNTKIRPNAAIEKILKTRTVRTISGVAIITVLTKPYPCPGKCLYCPNEKGMPKSYLSNEPAAMRAVLNNFNPFQQVKMRLKALKNEGHKTDKIELIVLGGTWSAYPSKYQKWFVKKCFDAANLSTSHDLKRAQKKNEKAQNRIIGLTLETRPDYITIKEIKKMREFGCTRIELGVQSLDDSVLKLNRRGHNVTAIIKATKLLKDAGFKVNYHMMLNLPGSNLEKDEKMFDKLFSNQDFQPDLLKIYPCVVLKTAPLYKVWKQNVYRPYTEKQLIDLLLRIKKKIPLYVRIQRIIRDIPSNSIVAGNKITNLRQIIDQGPNKICRCIRCREIKGAYSPKTKLELLRYDYPASDGKEIFLSFEDKTKKNLYALLRLRIPSQYFEEQQQHFLPVLEDTALIREVHTYGEMVSLNSKQIKAAQHTGLGKKLIAEAERIAQKEFGLRKMAVISGIGVRDYYRKLGYRLKNKYMIKKFATSGCYTIH